MLPTPSALLARAIAEIITDDVLHTDTVIELSEHGVIGSSLTFLIDFAHAVASEQEDLLDDGEAFEVATDALDDSDFCDVCEMYTPCDHCL